VSCPRAGCARPERKGTAAAECSLVTGNLDAGSNRTSRRC
jgi:hypothetical protein